MTQLDYANIKTFVLITISFDIRGQFKQSVNVNKIDHGFNFCEFADLSCPQRSNPDLTLVTGWTLWKCNDKIEGETRLKNKNVQPTVFNIKLQFIYDFKRS